MFCGDFLVSGCDINDNVFILVFVVSFKSSVYDIDIVSVVKSVVIVVISYFN